MIMKRYDESFNQMRADLSFHAQKGVPLFLAGSLFWLAAFLSGLFFPVDVTLWVYIIGIGTVFPLGIGISRLLKINLLAPHNPLSTVGGLIGGIQIFFAPLVIMVYFYEPQWMPFVVGVLTGAHFLPYVALYNSKTYLFQTVATVAAATFFGVFLMEKTFIWTPLSILAVYMLTIIGLKLEYRKEDLRESGQDG